MISPAARSPPSGGVGPTSPFRPMVRTESPFTGVKFPLARSAMFTLELSEEQEDQTQAQEIEDARQWEEEISTSDSAECVDFSEEEPRVYSSSDEGTQLAVASGTRSFQRPPRPIPIPSSSRARSASASLPNPTTPFSPAQSRVLQLGPSSASPPTWSRRRRRRGQRHASLSPGPASVEERRLAHARGERDSPDDHDSEGPLGGSFADILDGRSTFIGMSRAQGGGFGADASGTALVDEDQPAHLESLRWSPEPISSSTSSLPSDLYLASSVPDLDLSSVEGEEEKQEISRRGKGGLIPKKGGEADEPGEEDWSWAAWFRRTLHLDKLRGWPLACLTSVVLIGVGFSG